MRRMWLAAILAVIGVAATPAVAGGPPQPPCSGFVPTQHSFVLPLPKTGSLTFLTATLKPGASASAICNISENTAGLPAGIRAAAAVGKAVTAGGVTKATIVVGINNLATKRAKSSRAAGENLDVIILTSAQAENVVVNPTGPCGLKKFALKALREHLSAAYTLRGSAANEAEEIIDQAAKRLPC